MEQYQGDDDVSCLHFIAFLFIANISVICCLGDYVIQP
jgi:hypothetical protein